MPLSTVHQLCHRLSLRKPQEKSLTLLAGVVDDLELSKQPDLQHMLGVVKQVQPHFQDFERDFPSFCFALATGVGKTRLMGAFVAYLYLTGRSRHFLVLAPNLTIYEKLIQDFTPYTPKYVFKGIPDLAIKPPVIVTGDNYEEGRGIRHDKVMGVTGDLFDGGPVINIFNIAKINAKDNKKGAAKSTTPKTRRLLETLGQSYFDYLAELDDLVVLMDEAHRYYAKAGTQAISDLNPILGLELTATPKTVGANSRQFKNILHHYPLAHALADGFVKIPAVATRKDFNPKDYKDRPKDLEIIKLEDGIHHHEYVRVELERYAYENRVETVKPFMLVVAQDTTHSGELKTIIESDDFFEGRYRGKVIEVHSNQGAEESDEAMQRLLAVEHDKHTEIVIHVNKLKEGWDVTNLYTIVPLRASAAEILTEQTIGRGLRLPYGYRTGDEAVDRLTIISHDRFQEIIDRANDPDSIIHQSITIGEGGDIPEQRSRLLQVPSTVETNVTGEQPKVDGADYARSTGSNGHSEPHDPRRATAARITMEVIRQQESSLNSSSELTQEKVQEKIYEQVTETWNMQQGIQPELAGLEPQKEAEQRALLDEVVKRTTEQVAASTIDIPNIIVMPDSMDQSYYFEDFELEGTEAINYPPVSEELILKQLTDNKQFQIQTEGGYEQERRLEDYIVRELMDYNEIDYDAHANLLYKLAGQVVDRLGIVYSDDTDEVRKALIAYQKQLGQFIWVQMEQHIVEPETGYFGKVTQGFSVLQPLLLELTEDEEPRNFRQPIKEKSRIRQMVFSGFNKCSYPYQKFDSADGELRLAMLLEDDPEVIKWLKPAPRQFRIEYSKGRSYEPDFVVETAEKKLLIEPKRADQMNNEEVQEKATAAREWVEYANQHVTEHGGKPWEYLLVPHDDIRLGGSVAGLIARFS